jgi:hypothetical protein
MPGSGSQAAGSVRGGAMDTIDDDGHSENPEDRYGGMMEQNIDQDILSQKLQLEEMQIKLSYEVSEKNDKIVELLNDQEELKVEIYARDQNLEKQQK